MTLFTISFNQLIEASKATERTKTRIVKNQLKVVTFLANWYQTAKNRIKLYFRDVSDYGVLYKAISDLKNKPVKNDKAKKNISVSIEAINKVIGMRFDKILANGYEVIDTKEKTIEIHDINININLDLVFRYVEDGIKKIGGLKFHISKTKPFDKDRSRLMANVIKIYLQEKIVKDDELVDERLCWAYDIFTDRLMQADKDVNISKVEIASLCEELKKIYKSI